MARKEERPLLTGVVFKKQDVWVAQCFTVDHAAQADNPRTAIKECVDGVLADIEFAIEHDAFGRLKPLPLAEQLAYLAARSPEPPKVYRSRSVSVSMPAPQGGTTRVRGLARFESAAALQVA